MVDMLNLPFELDSSVADKSAGSSKSSDKDARAAPPTPEACEDFSPFLKGEILRMGVFTRFIT